MLCSLRTAVSRRAIAIPAATTTRGGRGRGTAQLNLLCRRRHGRGFSTTSSGDCEPAQRIRHVLEEYRKEHFSRELPSRFKKECVRAIATGDGNTVELDSLNIMLNNIGRQDACLNEKELLQLLQELGADSNSRTVSVEKIMQLM